ncbi:hypothetical protein C809_00962 [Lachnospiraceae bacterium MD335]|jgi:hypothetical protein|nr:hypothetical protein C809_00962 [Lachnospiraceae bacterium MD335]
MGKLKGVIIAVVLVALVGGFYFYVSNIGKDNDDVVVSAVQNVLLRNLDNDYPATPKELVKYYGDITKCLYNENYSEEQLAQMADKMIALYDDELAENNPRDQYIVDLKAAVKDFSDKNYTIISYTTSSSTDVEEYTHEGRKCASLYCTYSIKTGADYVSSKQVFVLRKESGTGHWKILGFDIINE